MNDDSLTPEDQRAAFLKGFARSPEDSAFYEALQSEDMIWAQWCGLTCLSSLA